MVKKTGKPAEKLYRGRRVGGRGGYVEITVTEVKAGIRKTTALRHRVRHSPTGLEWGYNGSGPSDLSRSLLWDYTGTEPVPEVYQRFKDLVVARWAEDTWEISSIEIDTVLTKMGTPAAV